MIRLGKLTDYGLVLMTYIARNHDRSLHTARVLSVESRLRCLREQALEGATRGWAAGFAPRSQRRITV